MYYPDASFRQPTREEENEMEIVHRTKDDLRTAFENTKVGVDPKVVDDVMKGVPFNGDNAPEVRALRSAWAQYHETMRY
jgi:hypothetical protein